MIATKTVLVLGAGASAPYGFPTGGALVELIANDFASPRFAKAEKVMPEGYRILTGRLRQAQHNSIDEFLENHPSFADIGRQAIALHLLPAESHSGATLMDLTKKDHWYRYLKGQLGPLGTFGKNQLRIISFNYDRSVEHYLYETSRTSDERINDQQCVEILKQLPVLHVYGNLGPLPWQSRIGTIPYGGSTPEPCAEEIRQAAMNIKILHQGTDDEVQQNFRIAQEWLKWAERIVVLGFGFHHANVERLALTETFQGKREVVGTCKDLALTNRAAALHVTFPRPAADCYTLLHDHVVLL